MLPPAPCLIAAALSSVEFVSVGAHIFHRGFRAGGLFCLRDCASRTLRALDTVSRTSPPILRPCACWRTRSFPRALASRQHPAADPARPCACWRPRQPPASAQHSPLPGTVYHIPPPIPRASAPAGGLDSRPQASSMPHALGTDFHSLPPMLCPCARWRPHRCAFVPWALFLDPGTAPPILPPAWPRAAPRAFHHPSYSTARSTHDIPVLR